MLTSSLSIILIIPFGMLLLLPVKSEAIPTSLRIGSSFTLGCLVVTLLISGMSWLGMSLSRSSETVLAMAIITSALLLWVGRKRFLQCLARGLLLRPRQKERTALSLLADSPFTVWLLLLVAVHFIFSAANNLNHSIFPWDAFTTWMYRAKAWVLMDAISPLTYSGEWLANGGSENLAIYANRYPTSLSILAAFPASLGGGWNANVASLPWSFALLAATFTSFGTSRLAGHSRVVSLLSAYFLSSLALLTAHASLAGYGDLWIALSSGAGLTLLLTWRVAGSPTALWLGLSLLVVGTQFKTEGWLWLGLGLAFIVLEYTLLVLRWQWLLLYLIATALLFISLDLTTVSLGPLGQWGMSDTRVYAGVIGDYALRPYNPAINYWRSFTQSPNFHLLAVGFMGALAVLTLSSRQKARPFWILLGLIAISQIIIFGLSDHSRFAESGTAINRLVLHFLPVFIFTIGHALAQLETAQSAISTKQFFAGLALAVIAFMMSIQVMLSTDTTDMLPPIFLDSKDVMVVLGSTEKVTVNGDSAITFSSSDTGFGVLKAPNGIAVDQLPSLVKIDATVTAPSTAFFYWINRQSAPNIHRIPLNIGTSHLLDLKTQSAWGADSISEYGIIVAEDGFDTTLIRRIDLVSNLSWQDIPALLTNWTAPITPTQVTLNDLQQSTVRAIGLSTLLNVSAAILLSLLLFAQVLKQRSFNTLAQQPILIGLLALWITSDIAWLMQTRAWPQLTTTENKAWLAESGAHLIEPARLARSYLERDKPVLIIPANATASFEAQKLPYMLLPLKSAFVGPGDTRLAQDWPGNIVVIGKYASDVDQVALQLQMIRAGEVVNAHPTLAIIR